MSPQDEAQAEEELLRQAEMEEELDDGWDPDYQPSRPRFDWREMQAGRQAYDRGRARRAPLTIWPRRRRSWLAGWDFGKKKARQRQQETLAAAVADLMEAVEEYAEARRHGYEGVEESGAVGVAVRVLIQAAARYPDAALEVPL